MLLGVLIGNSVFGDITIYRLLTTFEVSVDSQVLSIRGFTGSSPNGTKSIHFYTIN